MGADPKAEKFLLAVQISPNDGVHRVTRLLSDWLLSRVIVEDVLLTMRDDRACRVGNLAGRGSKRKRTRMRSDHEIG